MPTTDPPRTRGAPRDDGARAGLRNEAMRQALDRAVTSGDRYLFTLLTRFGNLPGPRPNLDLAVAVADHLASLRSRSDRLVIDLCSLDEREAPGQSAQVFLVVVGAHALAARALEGFDTARALDGLQTLAGDHRKPVRDGAASALARLLREGDLSRLVDQLATWTDGFLQAAVALEALTTREVLDRITDPSALLARLDEATNLAETASRAAERTQGRRRLLEVLPDTIAAASARFPATLRWLELRCATEQPELRESFERALSALQRTGLVDADLDPIRRALDTSRAPLRDPTHYKGPTRGRGRKAQRRAERR